MRDFAGFSNCNGKAVFRTYTGYDGMSMAGLVFLTIFTVGGDSAPTGNTELAAVLATARITNPRTGALGSGIILHRDDSFAYVLTAGHIVRQAGAVRVQVFSARTYPQPAATFDDALVL